MLSVSCYTSLSITTAASLVCPKDMKWGVQIDKLLLKKWGVGWGETSWKTKQKTFSKKHLSLANRTPNRCGFLLRVLNVP